METLLEKFNRAFKSLGRFIALAATPALALALAVGANSAAFHIQGRLFSSKGRLFSSKGRLFSSKGRLFSSKGRLFS
ncbi:MAG: hypothetical protein L0229_01965, partial [Blastocatellia bacterium]|nr:hypothetical protein [Blastocatellia bacterium]